MQTHRRTIGEAIFLDRIVRHAQEVAVIIEQIHVQFQLQVHIPNNNNIDRDMIDRDMIRCFCSMHLRKFVHLLKFMLNAFYHRNIVLL